MNILNLLVNSTNLQTYEADNKQKATHTLRTPILSATSFTDIRDSAVCVDLASEALAVRIRDQMAALSVIQEADLKLVNWGDWEVH